MTSAPYDPVGDSGAESADLPLKTESESQAHPGQSQLEKPAKGKTKKKSFLREFVSTIAIALVLAIVLKTFFVQAFYIPSPSMVPTLAVQDRILVNKLAPKPFKVHRGDIVVFVDPGTWLEGANVPKQSGVGKFFAEVFTFIGLLPANSGKHLVKRVIGVGGDRVECCTLNGKLTVNGTEITEPYIFDQDWYAKSNRAQDTFSITVPEGDLWVMGDNRLNSLDSRYHTGDLGGGAIPVKNVVGVAFLLTWPLDRFGLLRNPGDTFANVH